jgi:hypothetical protein
MLPALGGLAVVSGTSLYTTDVNKVSTLRGSIGTPGAIDMAENGSAVIVVNPPNAYYWNGTTFAQITDVDFPGAIAVDFLDNYFLFVEPDSGRFFCADLGSATAFNALNFATAEGSPDNLVGLKVDHRQAVLFGLTSIEIWENTGAAGFPFERVINGFLEIGCFNGRLIAKQDNSLFWVANDYTVRRLDGNTPVRVSTHAIEQFLTTVTMGSGKAYAYSQDGHLFVCLHFPEGTVVYDCTTREWHERQTYGRSDWIAQYHASVFGLEIVGDSTSNRIGYFDASTYTEWGETQRMEWTYQPVYGDGKRAFHDNLEIVMETGVGLTTGQGSAPEIMLYRSDDGGTTWNSHPNKSIGAIGNYRTRVRWHGMGSAEQRVYRGAISDPVKVAITDTQLQVRGGRV